ncbi:MAG: branched-chain amino acid ABC transporter permease [Actinomycetota bacterium]
MSDGILHRARYGTPYLLRDHSDLVRLHPWSIHRVAGWALLAIVILTLPLVASSFFVNVANFVLIAAIGALGLQVVTGMAGQLSLGHAAFLATGAFLAAGLHLHLSVPFWLALPAAGLAGAALGLVSGLPALRLRGLYLGITTLAVQSVVLTVALRYQTYLQDSRGTGADLTVPAPTLGPLLIDDAVAWYPFLIVCTTIAVVWTSNTRRSVLGRAWVAVREGEVAAEALGVPVRGAKVLAFVISGAIGAIAGAISAYYFRSVSVEDFDLVVSVEYLAMIIIGGLGTVQGAVLGAAFVTATPFVVGELVLRLGLQPTLGRHLRSIELGVFAVVTVAFLLFEPRGLSGTWRRFRAYFERWPYGFVDVQRSQR